MGLEVSEEHILTPLLPLLEQVEQEGIKNLFSLFPPEVLAYLKEKAPQINWQSSVEEAQGLVVGFDTSLDYEKLSKAARILQKEGSFYWATHLDKVCPTPNGGIPDCGSMVALLNEVNHREPQLVFGKPDPRLLGSLGKEFALEEMVFSGDRLYTDQELAIRAKMDFVLVLSGESSREDIKENTPVPTHIVEDWGEFLK
jgi:ribonucleotide monophosphatase NagD (HAD superfamily)